MRRVTSDGLDLKDQVIAINRVTKVVKGGKNLSFSALVVVGDEHGVVGYGTGKAREVPLKEQTIPHQTLGHFGAGRVLLKPAREGTGVIAGGPVRAIMQAVGVHNIVTKCIGTNNAHNVVRATFEGLRSLKDPAYVMRLRGKDAEEQ